MNLRNNSKQRNVSLSPSFHLLASTRPLFCQTQCVLSQTKNISGIGHFSFNGPEKWIYTFVSSRINKQCVSMQLFSCQHPCITPVCVSLQWLLYVHIIDDKSYCMSNFQGIDGVVPDLFSCYSPHVFRVLVFSSAVVATDLC